MASIGIVIGLLILVLSAIALYREGSEQRPRPPYPTTILAGYYVEMTRFSGATRLDDVYGQSLLRLKSDEIVWVTQRQLAVIEAALAYGPSWTRLPGLVDGRRKAVPKQEAPIAPDNDTHPSNR